MGKEPSDTVKAGPLRVGTFKSDSRNRRAIDRVQVWTRERFNLDEAATVLVTELVCTRPGCPPLETVVAFWVQADQRRHFKVFKPVADVVQRDLPPAWLMDALCAEPDDGDGCC
jgi:nitrate reductase delta subunit